MKHGANVRNDGTYDFSRTDELEALIRAAGMEVYGHTLVWHQNNNGTYLRSLTGAGGPNLLQNPGFESDFANWFTQVSSTPPTAGNIAISTGDVQSGSKAAKVTVTTPGSNPWSIQMSSDNFSVTNNAAYVIKFWAKSAVVNQSLRVVSQGTSYYQQQEQPLSTTWTEYSFPITPTEVSVAVKFHFPNTGEFFIDNISVQAAGSSLSPALVNTALQSWINAIVGRFTGKVKAWDVVNEAFEENGSLRTGTNSGDVFFWYPVLGRSYIANAFRYANTADPNALLFINDYNLEHSPQKLDSFVAMVNELKTQAIPIHGVASQMHININTSNSSIDNMFIKLAATGLKVHVSELDIRINPNNQSPFVATSDLLLQQAEKYKYIAESYIRNIPVAQRYGITVWNLTDADSWIVTSLGRTDFPTLFNSSYQPKSAYTYFRTALQ